MADLHRGVAVISVACPVCVPTIDEVRSTEVDKLPAAFGKVRYMGLLAFTYAT